MRTATIEDAEVQAMMQPWIGMECFQLSRGRLVANIQSLDFGSCQIVRETQYAAVQKIGVTPTNLCTLSFCTPAPGFRFSDHSGSSAGNVFLMPENTAFDIFVPAGAETVYVSLDQESLISGARILNPRDWAEAPLHVTAFDTIPQASFGGMVTAWLAAANKTATLGSPLDVQTIERNVFDALLQLISTSTTDDFTPPARWRSFQICRKAKTFIEEWNDVEAQPGIVDLCAAVGVSARTLQYAFRDYVGMSPVTYLRLWRLNRAHAALLEADTRSTSVTEVAMQFNFGHLGRFSGDYNRLFGEVPSITLAR
ncbi:AraC family transcriptional regulator [Falsihalocynthiibacter arcticus]|uniref:AraC family transcriptional regulator n=1 Tax=Falsihalocynthiibacter arcticus TaxID=1579316 RepID=UPI0014700442|nr:AraC family transcriptional regulator [Falsihalocynthiibacter arcticus]